MYKIGHYFAVLACHVSIGSTLKQHEILPLPFQDIVLTYVPMFLGLTVQDSKEVHINPQDLQDPSVSGASHTDIYFREAEPKLWLSQLHKGWILL
jgi:hypothetical protein